MKILAFFILTFIFIEASIGDLSESLPTLKPLQVIRKLLANSPNQTIDYIKLSAPGNVLMPIIGLGTWQAAPETIDKAILEALDAGYRHIDTAFNYKNEEAIGASLKNWIESGKGKREDVFITTKLPPQGSRASDVEKYLNWSLRNLQTDYIDLYLIHWPVSLLPDETGTGPKRNEDGSIALDYNADNLQTWKELEKFVKQGKIRAIGLSNFNTTQIENIYNISEIKPSVIQVELHLYHQQNELRSLSKDLNIAVTAYAPLGSPNTNFLFNSTTSRTSVLGNPVVKELAEKYGKTTAQIVLRHLVQQDIIVIPKSTHPERIKQNIDIFDFELTPEEIQKLNSLDRDEDGRIFTFTFIKGITKHPQFPFKIKE